MQPHFTPPTAAPSNDEALLLPLLHAEDCPNQCGRQGRPGFSIYCSDGCRTEAFQRIDEMIWSQSA